MKKDRPRHLAPETKKTKFYKVLFFLPILLSIFGLIFVFEASSVRSFTEYGTSFHYLQLQTLWIFIGIGIMIFFSFFDYRRFQKLALPFMIGTIILLILVLIPHVGSKIGGARRWIDLGFFNLQPTELAKVATIIYLATWFKEKEKQRFFAFLFFIGVILGLIMLQPDMGTSMVIYGLSVVMYFLAGVELQYLMAFLPASFLGALALIHISPYRFNRLKAFLNPSEDQLGIGFHINQIFISLTNGGLIGQGFGNSKQKYLFLPEAHTDSIFAIIGEETGFVGGLLLIGAFILLIYLLYRVVASSHDRFAFLLSGGIFAYFGIQVIFNLASMVGLMPLTGVPLPFISYGGSHILIAFMLIGIIINISKKRAEL
ncbi:MAG: putative lipid II flippase FtsW [Patescibacteria group bacterium]